MGKEGVKKGALPLMTRRRSSDSGKAAKLISHSRCTFSRHIWSPPEGHSAPSAPMVEMSCTGDYHAAATRSCHCCPSLETQSYVTPQPSGGTSAERQVEPAAVLCKGHCYGALFAVLPPASETGGCSSSFRLPCNGLPCRLAGDHDAVRRRRRVWLAAVGELGNSKLLSQLRPSFFLRFLPSHHIFPSHLLREGYPLPIRSEHYSILVPPYTVSCT